MKFLNKSFLVLIMLASVLSIEGCARKKQPLYAIERSDGSVRNLVDLEKECQQDNSESCHDAGIIRLLQKEDKTNPQAIMNLFQKGCDLGSTSSCKSLSSSYTSGKLVPVDYKKAASILESLCHKGNSDICVDLALKYKTKKIIAENYNQSANALFQEACDMGNKKGCFGLGTSYLVGSAEGIPQDLTKASQLFSQSCNMGYNLACTSLARSYEDGSGVEKNALKALEFYKKGCDLQDKQACTELGNHYKVGINVPVDSEKSKTYFKKACSFGNKNVCSIENNP